MNCLLQQFFMIPTFRYNLLSLEDQSKKIDGDDKDKMHMLERLQEMFANLELSEKSSYEMSNWCQSFK